MKRPHLIETKEQYEELQLMRLIPKHGPPVGKYTHKPVFETIEALREVARAGRASEQMFDVMATDGIKSWLSYPMQQIYATNHTGLRLALDALPDWITESEHE